MAQYETRILHTAQEIAGIAESWNRLRLEQDRPHIEQHPDWLTRVTHTGTEAGETPLVVALYEGEQLVGVAPFVLRRWRWPCRLGYKTVARFPMRMADLCGETLIAPNDSQAQDAILRALAAAADPYQMVFLESLPTDSPFWRLIQESAVVREQFWIYLPTGVTPHWWIHLPDSFEEYLTKFSSRARRRLQNSVRKLEEACDGQMVLQRITERSQVPAFLEQVERLSERSWQGARLGKIIRATEAERERLGAMADRGWLRGYLLSRGEEGLAFFIGWQADAIYYACVTGYNPDWASYGPGKALHYLRLQDLFEWNTPRWLDFGSGDSENKRFFGNHVYDEAHVYLIRKSAYTGLARATHGACNGAAAATRTALDQLQLREKVRRLLRGRSAQPAPAARPLTPSEETT